MTSQEKGKAAEERKRKHKFSEKELEVLTEEVVKQHDMLFGKKSLHVPESTKRTIWIGIQERINAIGVTQRSIDDLKKRWYDLRSRAKERVADRLKQAHQTGGGSSTADTATPLEELVESTLITEAVVGVGKVDSSGRKGSRKGAAEPTPSEGERREEEALVEEEEPVADITTPATTPSPLGRRRHTVKPLPAMEDEEEGTAGTQDSDSDHGATPPTCNQSPPGPGTIARGRRRGRIPDPESEASVFAGLEGKMLKVQRMQAKSLRTVNQRLMSMDRGMRVLATGLNTLTNTVAEGQRAQLQCMNALTGAVTSLCRQLQGDRSSRRRHTVALQGYTKAVNRLCNATAVLGRRTVAVQLEMAHSSQDLARGLTQVTCAVEELKTVNLAAIGHGDRGDSEDVSSRSTITPPLPEPRRRSTRQGSTDEQCSHEGGATGARTSGQRGRKH